jgi:hypothetical protein
MSCACGVLWDEAYYADTFGMSAGLGVDVFDGDPVLNLGDGIGVDLVTGGVDVQVAPFVDIPL